MKNLKQQQEDIKKSEDLIKKIAQIENYAKNIQGYVSKKFFISEEEKARITADIQKIGRFFIKFGTGLRNRLEQREQKIKQRQALMSQMQMSEDKN